MANSRSARKRIRANERKHLRNRAVRSAVRTSITKARRSLVATEPAEETADNVLRAVKALDRAAEKGILHRKNADRRKSRLMTLAHKLTAAGEGDTAAQRAAAVGGVKGRGKTTRARSAAAKPASKTAAARPAARGAAARGAAGRATAAARAAAAGTAGAASTRSTASAPATTTKTTTKTTKTRTSRAKKS